MDILDYDFVIIGVCEYLDRENSDTLLARNTTQWLKFDFLRTEYNEQVYGFKDVSKASIRYLTGCSKLDYLFQCTNLITLEFADMFNELITEKHLPLSVVSIKFGYWYTKQFIYTNACTANIYKLEFDVHYPIEYIVPHMQSNNTVKELILNINCNDIPQKFHKHTFIPTGVRVLTLKPAFKAKLYSGFLPDSLRELYLSDGYEQEIGKNVLNPGLELLSLGHKYTHAFAKKVLPKSLRNLTVSIHYKHDLSKHIHVIHKHDERNQMTNIKRTPVEIKLNTRNTTRESNYVSVPHHMLRTDIGYKKYVPGDENKQLNEPFPLAMYDGVLDINLPHDVRDFEDKSTPHTILVCKYDEIVREKFGTMSDSKHAILKAYEDRAKNDEYSSRIIAAQAQEMFTT